MVGVVSPVVVVVVGVVVVVVGVVVVVVGVIVIVVAAPARVTLQEGIVILINVWLSLS